MEAAHASEPATLSIGPSDTGRRLTRAVFGLAGLGMLLAFAGLLWDHAWHTTTALDEFWSPPHVVLYAGLALVMLTSLSIFVKPVRDSLGGGLVLRVPFLSFPVPAPLLLLAVGTLVAILSGMMDQKWHESLRGAESFYSLPHNFIIMGAIVAALGLRAGATVLRGGRAERSTWAVPVFTAAFLIVFMRLFSSFGDTRAEYLARLENPALAADPNWVALQQAYLSYDVLADSVLLAPVMLVAALVTPLAYAEGLTGRRWTATRAAAVFGVQLAAVDAIAVAAGYRPLWTSPAVFFVLPAALAADLSAPRFTDRPWARWVIAALVFTGAHGVLYGYHAAGVAFAAVGGALAWRSGSFIADFVDRPTPRRLAWGLLLMGLVFPVALGGLDVLLRFGTYYWLF